MEEILIDVSKDGKCRVTTSGFKGRACEEATASLISALGGDVVSDSPTPEMYESESQGESQEQK